MNKQKRIKQAGIKVAKCNRIKALEKKLKKHDYSVYTHNEIRERKK